MIEERYMQSKRGKVYKMIVYEDGGSQFFVLHRESKEWISVPASEWVIESGSGWNISREEAEEIINSKRDENQ